MKIDLLRLERSNTDDNKNRTQLRLLKNQIGLLEQELEHIQAQITAAEGIVNDVWRDVTTTSPTKLKLASQGSMGAGEFSSATKELSSVVGRFAAHMARLQRKHDIEVKAAAMLAKPWKKQMEELQLRMVIKIQRAYRARRRAREIKQKAREELHEKIRQRELQKQNELLDRKRHEALQEKDLQRHQARMLAMQQQEKAARDAIQQKQQQLVDRMRRERISEMDRERNRKLLHRILKTWTAFLKMQEKRRDASRLFLKFQFMRWRHHFVAFKHLNSAARTLQRIFRRRQEKRSLRKAMQMRRKRNAMAQRYLHKLQSRHMQRIFNQWIQWSAEQVRLKANFRAIVQRRMDDWLQRWVRFVQTWKQRRLDATILVQRVYRSRLARRVFQAQRVRCISAKTIQRVYRGFRGRNAASRRRQIKHHQDSQTAMLRLRIQRRLLGLCLAEWCTHTRRIRHMKRMAQHRRRHHLEDTFDGFACYRQHKREKRAAFVRRQYNSAVVIQRHYRRHRCQVVFRKSIVHHRAAVKIQRVYRGYEGRQRVRKLRWEIGASRKLQTAWRKRQARRLAEKTRAEGILLAAYKGDYTATQRAIASGYAYVVDQEHNTILHMAAAAGHKRLVKLCLRHHMDINAVNLHGQSPLHLLLTNIPPSLPGFDEDGETRRIIDERVALAAYMIDHSAWHEATDALGLTPLLLSAALGQTEATEMLLEKSANTDARSSAGLNAVQLSIEGNHPHTLRALLASRGFDTAANAGDTLRQLHACAGRGLIDCLRVLLEHMANYELSANQFNLRDDDGYTSLIYAISNCNADAVQSLLESGASPDQKDFFGRPPLHFAVTAGDGGSSAIVELLTTYDVDVNVKDTDGDSALHTSCDCDARIECTSLLLRSGAVIGANMLGNHPTHIAARRGAVETLKLLVEYGADMNIKNYEGKTPLGLARMFDQKAVVQYIKQYFAAEPISHADDEPPVTKGDGVDGEHDEDDEYPTRTYEQWQVALTSAFHMGTLAEWTHYVDAETEFSFFTCPSADGEALTIFTWESPIEFDAALGDTWEVMRSGVSGVALRSRQHTGDTGEGDNNEKPGGGDKPSSRARAGMGVRYLYHNKRTGETRSAVPPIDYSLLQDVVQNSKRHQQLRQRIRKVSADTSDSAMEYMRFFREFEAESAQTRAEILAAIQIQRHFRARRTTRMVRLLLLENKRAIDLQRAFRGRQARKLVAHRRLEHICATKIQALWRGLTARQQEKTNLHAKRLDHRKRRRCALQIQRLFRGHRARLLAYREKVIQKHGPRGYFAWEQFRRRAVVKQSFKVWDEMELPLEFPGVFFYCHQVTRSCAWEKSKEWQAHDVEQFHERCQLFRWGYTQPMRRAAIRLQSLWRARQARIGFRLIMKAVQLMKGAEQEYLEDPTNLVKMGNYVLFLHAIRHDYERARPLYARLMRTMAQRGPDVPFILFSYALFLFVTQEDDVALVEDMILRAKRLDRQLLKYKLAFLGFFRQSMLQNPHDGESNLNYAACLQWLFEQYDESIPYYLRAIAANPHKKGSLELFQDMLNRKRQVDKATHPHLFAKPTGNVGKRSRAEIDELRATYDAFEVFRRWQVQQAQQDDFRRRKQLEADQEVADRLQAARKIQARYRRRCAMRKVNRVRVERQLALSMADLADTKSVYDCVRSAFAQVAAPQPTTKFKIPKAKHATSSANPLSVPVALLENIFRAMELPLSPDDMRGTIEAFRALHGKALHVNVMDVTSFAQSNVLVMAKLKETRMGKAKG
jgi:ankyrin repeat protein